MQRKYYMSLTLSFLAALSLCLIPASYGRADDPDFYPVYVANGWNADPLPFAVVPYFTGAIAFDDRDNFYTAYLSGGAISILKHSAPDYDVSNPSVFVSYSKTFDSVSGIDFDAKGNLFVSEIISSNNTGYPYSDAGLIRMIRANNLELSAPIKFENIDGVPGDNGDLRPTGLAATGKETVFFPGRQWSDSDWGNIYRIDSFKKYVPGTEPAIVRQNLSMFAIADDKWGQIFVADYSIYARNPYTQIVLMIAAFAWPKYVEELAFDSKGNLYALEGIDDPGPYDPVKILKIVPPQIIISGCNTGIIDWPMQDGSTIGEAINTGCAGSWPLGDFVSCVAGYATGFMEDGLLSPQQMAAIVTCAANGEED